MTTKSNLGTTFKALLAAWVTLIFGTSLLMFLFAPIEHKINSSNSVINALQSTWELGDAIGPIVKISLILIFSLLIFSIKDLSNQKPVFLYITSIMFALVSTFIILGILPAEYSRGYGVGLTGNRFDREVLHIYLIGAGLGGVVFAYTFNKLSLKNAS